jgi:hypothetical protein
VVPADYEGVDIRVVQRLVELGRVERDCHVDTTAESVPWLVPSAGEGCADLDAQLQSVCDEVKELVRQRLDEVRLSDVAAD